MTVTKLSRKWYNRHVNNIKKDSDMEINIYDLLFLLVFGSIAMNMLWRLLCYELRIHFADNYVVKIIYHDEFGKTDACYAIKSVDENDACLRALQLFKKKNICFSHIDSINAVEIDSINAVEISS